jgi:hypothetical protein
MNDPSKREHVTNMTPLSRQQINQCKMEIEDVHPLREKHVTDILPPMKCFQLCGCFKKKKSLRDALRVALVNELRDNFEPLKGVMPNIPENEVDRDDNPFSIAGYGVNSFFDIMLRLVYMMIGISVVCFPVMVMFNHNPEQGIV